MVNSSRTCGPCCRRTRGRCSSPRVDVTQVVYFDEGQRVVDLGARITAGTSQTSCQDNRVGVLYRRDRNTRVKCGAAGRTGPERSSASSANQTMLLDVVDLTT